MRNSFICDKSSFLELLPTNEVIVMEDRVTTQEAIKEILEREFNLQVKIVDSKEDAIDHAEKNRKIQCYLLDVHMGNDRQQEGIDALEEIKAINEKSFVSIFTGYPSQKIQRMASRLGADSYREKSFDLENDIREIGSQIKKHYRDLLQEQLQTQTIDRFRKDIIDELEKINKLDKLYDSPSTPLLFQDDVDIDNNINTTEPKSLDRKLFVTQIIVKINWFLLVILALCFCFVIYKAVYQENAIASEIIYHSFSLVLGWYGGLITSYLREK